MLVNRWVPWLVCLGFWLPFLPGKVLAQPKKPSREVEAEKLSEAKERYQEGDKYFHLGDFEKAAALFEQAYLLSQRPLLLRNLAICQEKLGNFEQAHHLWEAFRRSLSPKDPHLKEAQQRLKELEVILLAKAFVVKLPELQPVALTPPTVIVEMPEPKNRPLRTILVGGTIGGAVLGGVALTFLLANREVPQSSLGSRPIDF